MPVVQMPFGQMTVGQWLWEGHSRVPLTIGQIPVDQMRGSQLTQHHGSKMPFGQMFSGRKIPAHFCHGLKRG
jgi:hypothetical protein